MEELVSFVSIRAKLPLPAAKAAASAALDYLYAHSSRLLSSRIEVMLRYPDIDESQRDLMVALRVLFPPPASPNYRRRLDD